MSKVIYNKKDAVAHILFNNKELKNALCLEMAKEFRDLVIRIGKESDKPKVIILSGLGDVFSAGGDYEMLAGKLKKSAEDNEREMFEFYKSFLSILDLNIPLIAAINGHAIGAGLCIAAACDVRIVAREAKLGFTFTRLGLYPGMGATFFLPRIIGSAKSLELLLTGNVVKASELSETSFANYTVANEAVMNKAEEIAYKISKAGRGAMLATLKTLRASVDDLDQCLKEEAREQAISYASKEFEEGLSAIREKREPSFS